MRIVLLVALFWARVYAQPEETRASDSGFIGKDVQILEIDDCAAHEKLSAEELRKRAFEHFARGEVLYVQGDYKGAVKELVAAYCLSPVYTILKDIGQAYERELDYEKAIAYLSRYVMKVPKDAKRANACAPDPQDEKRNVLARIEVLSRLRAKILVNTDPPNAKITLSNDAGLAVRGVSGQELEVTGGRYQMAIEADGFHPVNQEVRAEIGKPYTIFTKLEPLKGKLRIRVVPGDARLFLDQRQVGTGTYEGELPGGRYKISAEAPGRLTVAREIEVFANRDTPLSFELPPEPQFGRTQLLIYSGIGGGMIGATLAGASEDVGAIAAAGGAGAVAGFVGTYFGTPRDIALGTSSLTITSSLVGGTLGAGSALLFTDEPKYISPAIGGGLIVGAAAGYYLGDRLRTKPGEAAVINSGAVWGTLTGFLFGVSFEADRQIAASLTLSGLGIGTLGGALLTRYFSVSRTRAVLIDVGGLVGVFVGIAAERIAAEAQSAGMSQVERTTNYMLGGMAAGLIIAGVITRNMDAPKLAVAPVITKTAPPGGPSTLTFGLGGDF